MKNITLIIFLLVVLISLLYFSGLTPRYANYLKNQKNQKNIETLNTPGEIAFVPPPLSSTVNIDQMRELMRIGSQSEENARFDNVATPLIQ